MSLFGKKVWVLTSLNYILAFGNLMPYFVAGIGCASILREPNFASLPPDCTIRIHIL